jgi:hypothetical protein
MIHGARPQDQPTLNGEVLKIINDGDTSPAMYTDRAVYYKGDLIEAASAVTEGTLDRGKRVAKSVQVIIPFFL